MIDASKLEDDDHLFRFGQTNRSLTTPLIFKTANRFTFVFFICARCWISPNKRVGERLRKKKWKGRSTFTLCLRTNPQFVCFTSSIRFVCFVQTGKNKTKGLRAAITSSFRVSGLTESGISPPPCRIAYPYYIYASLYLYTSNFNREQESGPFFLNSFPDGS